jgi:hypothetical protein
MSRIKASLAYGWAFLAAPLVLATFMGMDSLPGKLVAFTGLHVHPIYTGGEVAQTIPHGQYETWVHRPVFDGLIGPRSHGFIQIEWRPKDASLLPERLEEQVDLDTDATSRVLIRLNTKTNEAALEASGSRVLSIGEVLTAGNTRIVRVNLKAP